MDRWWCLWLLLTSGCTCGALDPNVTRFACSTNDDCAPGYRCEPAQGALECVLSADSGAGGGGGGAGGGGTGGGQGGGGAVDGGFDGGNAPPTVISTSPLEGATEVAIGASLTATFSRAMAAATITSLTFIVVQSSNAVSVSGAVTYAAATNTATFQPDVALKNDLVYTAQITTGSKSADGLELAAPRTWSFTTAPVGLGSAQTFSVLAESVSNSGSTTLSGDLGVRAVTSSFGFPPGTVSGATHVGDQQFDRARADLQVAYDAAVARTATTSLPASLSGATLAPGVYKSSAALSLNGFLTLDAQNDPTAVFLFQAEGALDVAAGSTIRLSNGARASRVLWQVVGNSTLGAASSFKGTIVSLGAITVGSGTAIEGRILSLNGLVSLASNTIVTPLP